MQSGGRIMSTTVELLEFGIAAAVIGGIVLWIVVLPDRTRKKPPRQPRPSRPAEHAAWDPDTDAGRRRR